MEETRYSRDFDRRLQRIEAGLTQVKILLMLLIFLVLGAVYAPRHVLYSAGWLALFVVLVIVGLYVFLFLLEKALNKKIGEDTAEKRLEEELQHTEESEPNKDDA